MIQVQDTHRLKYRNAILRAFKLSDRTTRIDFYNGEITADNNIGATVRTSEGGYIMRSSSQEMVTCLTVAEDAVIQVSLDGGTSWEIEWVVRLETDPESVRGTDAKVLKFKGDDGKFRSEAVLLNKDVSLPRYVTEAEYSSGEWAEGTIVVPNENDDYVMTNWTHTIIIDSVSTAVNIITPASVDVGGLVYPSLRAGQIVLIDVKSTDATITRPLRFNTLSSTLRTTFDVAQAGCYILRNGSDGTLKLDRIDHGITLGDITVEEIKRIESSADCDSSSGSAVWATAATHAQKGKQIFIDWRWQRSPGLVNILVPPVLRDWQYIQLDWAHHELDRQSTDGLNINLVFCDHRPEVGEQVMMLRIYDVANGITAFGPTSGTPIFNIAYRNNGHGLQVVELQRGHSLTWHTSADPLMLNLNATFGTNPWPNA